MNNKKEPTKKQIKKEMKENGYVKSKLKERPIALKQLREYLIKKGIIPK